VATVMWHFALNRQCGMSEVWEIAGRPAFHGIAQWFCPVAFVLSRNPCFWAVHAYWWWPRHDGIHQFVEGAVDKTVAQPVGRLLLLSLDE